MIFLSYDQKCLELAEFFLEEEGARRHLDADDLARRIQHTIESFLEEERANKEPRADPERDQMDASMRLLDYVMFGTKPK